MLRSLVRGAVSRGTGRVGQNPSHSASCRRQSGHARLTTATTAEVGKACSAATLCCALGVVYSVSCFGMLEQVEAHEGHRHSTIHNRGGNEPQPSIGTGRRCVGNAGHGYCCGRSIDDRDKGNDDDDSVGENYVEQHQQQQSRSNEAELLRRQARIFVEAGDTESGEMLLDKALEIDEIAHGTESVEVASGLSELALVLALQGRLGRADFLLRRALAIDVESFGWEGRETRADLNNFGLVLQEQGRNREAEVMFRKCVHVGERALPQDSLHLAMWRSNLARLLGSSCDRDRQLEALSLLRLTLDVFDKYLGPEDHDTLCVMERIACLHIRQSQWGLAEEILEAVVDHYEASVGVRHPRTIAASKNLREVLECQGKSWSSRRHLIGAYSGLAEAEEEHGQLHPAVEPALTGLAQVLRQEGRHEEALTLYHRAVQCVDDPGLSSSHPRVAAALNNYALALMQVGRMHEAEPLLWRSASILEVAYGKDHHLYFRGLSNLAGVLVSLGKTPRAMQLLAECVALATETLGPRHPDVTAYAMQLDKIASSNGVMTKDSLIDDGKKACTKNP